MYGVGFGLLACPLTILLCLAFSPQAYPGEGLGTTIRNVFDFDAYDGDTKDLLVCVRLGLVSCCLCFTSVPKSALCVSPIGCPCEAPVRCSAASPPSSATSILHVHDARILSESGLAN